MSSRRERQRRRNRSKSGPGFFILLSLGVLTATVAIVGLSFVGYVVSIANSAPNIADLKPLDQGENSVIYAKDGTRLGVIQSDVLRTPIPSTSIPQVMKDATVAIEDQRFYQHKGVDFEGVVRAAIKNFQNKGAKVQGGSTLTMQLIKNLYSRDAKRDYKRKIREAKLAEELENLHPGRPGKTWILTKYLNSVPYGTVGGQNAYGVQAAARVFFNKRASELTLPEAAMLAGLPQAPSQYNPYLDRAAALRRRDEVLKKMLDLGYIDATQYSDAVSTPIQLHKSSYYRQRREQYFFDYVKRELIKKYGQKTVRQGGLKVYTTLDFDMQKKARAAIAKNLAAPGSPSSALVSISPNTGQIRAMASSGDYGTSNFNLATQAKRQPGSTFKIIVLMTAIKRGVDINKTSYTSHKLKFFDPGTGTNIDVSNSDGAESGKAKSLFQAVVTSDNTVFQQLDLDLGPAEVTKTARAMGITSRMDSLPAEALGGLARCCTPLEMTRAFVSVNDGGYRIKPVAITKVVKADRTVDTSLGRPNKVKIFTDGETYEAIQAMKGNVQSGTGTAAGLGFCPAAGKTGTTSGFKDAWFNGMTSNLNTAVWVGYPKTNIPMTSVPNWGTMFGGKAPASIWHDFMASAVDRQTCRDWPQPKEPFVAQPFFGKYASQARSTVPDNTLTSPTTPTTPTTPGTGQGNPAGGGGQQYPPGQYSSPPQTTPTTPATTPPANPGTGGAAPTG
ncbi:MAG: glycosyl transferase [Solirubrobacterales bacterium]|nr:glycosyl transferase [Solirubrobacterales bacterium]